MQKPSTIKTKTVDQDRKYPTEKLLKSKHLKKYQPDFARVILTKPAYSISEAVETLNKKMRGGK